MSRFIFIKTQVDLARQHDRLLKLIDPPLKIGREKPLITVPQNLIAPIVSRNASTACRSAASAGKLIIRRPVRHRVIEGHFLAKSDIPHGDDADLAAETRIGIAAMVNIIGLFTQADRCEI